VFFVSTPKCFKNIKQKPNIYLVYENSISDLLNYFDTRWYNPDVMFTRLSRTHHAPNSRKFWQIRTVALFHESPVNKPLSWREGAMEGVCYRATSDTVQYVFRSAERQANETSRGHVGSSSISGCSKWTQTIPARKYSKSFDWTLSHRMTEIFKGIQELQ